MTTAILFLGSLLALGGAVYNGNEAYIHTAILTSFISLSAHAIIVKLDSLMITYIKAKTSGVL